MHSPYSTESVHMYFIEVLRLWRGASKKTAVSRTSQSEYSRSELARNVSGVHPAHQSTGTLGFVPWVPVFWYSERIPKHPESIRATDGRELEYVLLTRGRRARAPALRNRAGWLSPRPTTSSLVLSLHPSLFPARQTQDGPR